jgi:hypothetical protein
LGVGEGILHTGELLVMDFTILWKGKGLKKWKSAMDIYIFSNLPFNLKRLSTIWAMKKKVNGQYQARITAQGFLQKDGIHYFSHSTLASIMLQQDKMLRLLTWREHFL